MMDNEITREQYLSLREEARDPASMARIGILRMYFIHQGGMPLNLEQFSIYLIEAIADDPNLQDRIDKMFPMIVKFFDKYFEVTILFKNYGTEEIPDNRLLGMY